MPSIEEFSIAEAKNRLPAIVHDVETGAPVKLTRYGKPVAILLSIKAYENLRKGGKGFWKTLSELRKDLKNFATFPRDERCHFRNGISTGCECNFRIDKNITEQRRFKIIGKAST